jgi:hypothetical protein
MRLLLVDYPVTVTTSTVGGDNESAIVTLEIAEDGRWPTRTAEETPQGREFGNHRIIRERPARIWGLHTTMVVASCPTPETSLHRRLDEESFRV